MRRLRAEHADGPVLLASQLHDAWVELPQPGMWLAPRPIRMRRRLEHGEQLVVRSWGPFERVEDSKLGIELVVEGVTGVALQDDAKIGGLNLSSALFDASAGTLTIAGSIPATMTFSVSEVDVTAVILDEVVERRRRWRMKSSSSS